MDRFIINFFRKFNFYGLVILLAINTISCSDDDDATDPTPDTEEDSVTESFFISAAGESAEYILSTDTLGGDDLSIVGSGIELEQTGYNWIFNEDNTVTVGLIYAQGEPGIGLGYELDTAGELSSLGEFQITSRFTSYGFFEDYAITSVGGQTLVDEDGNPLTYEDGTERADGATFNFINTAGGLSLETQSIETYGLISEGQQVTFSGIVDMGNGEFLTGAVVSQAQDDEAEGGASTGTVIYPDSCWVVAFDENLEVQRVYRSNQLSYASGRYRSQYYSQIAKDDDGNVYVFSGAYDSNATNPAGALRINSGATDFDDSYYFNIEEIAEDYNFRKVWHITEDYFLLEFYNETVISSTNDPATQYGIVKMEDKTFNWVGGGFPSKDDISDIGLPMSYDGKLYFPITATGEYPTIYEIDPVTSQSTAVLSVASTNVEAIGLLKNIEE
ncbi:DUF4374 domain-containing protein [Chondrinema litorale]|uniref:DUF4374 domain-containing protein n=1 Tax=Chondrinema litorale TaxID=2994555 RepID=UPI002542DDAA|nr:DUF4374 domain-containing protein [Chondrinema litorale]UZR97752.1 DUF4374 domain-containing protein [Chondrinema litorale]